MWLTHVRWSRRAVSLAVALFLALALGSTARAQEFAGGAPGVRQAPVPLKVWNRHITSFRVPFESWSPEERVRRAVGRILAVPAGADAWDIAYHEEQLGAYKGYLFTIDGEFAFRLLEGDVDMEEGETLEQAAQAAEASLRAVMESRHEQRRWPLVLRGVVVACLLTLGLAASLFGVVRLKRALHARIRARLSSMSRRAVVAGVSVWPILGGLRQVLVRLANWSLVGLLVYLWLALVLGQFPYSRPWGEALGGFLVEQFTSLGWAILRAIPNLFVVFVIVAFTHAFNRGVGSYFLAIERGEASASWLTSEIARATRQILALLTWVFALVVAYPYIPGSETAAFKGVSVFFGLMVSLGSAGLVNQVMSGLTIIYSRAYRMGEYVRIGDQEGIVRNLGLLATTIEKPGGTEAAIPNAVVTVNTISNFSRGGGGLKEVLVATVTIGYDAPWRQVHGLLELAAKRTPQVVSEPAPLVLQRALSDFYVEYQLHVHLARAEERFLAQSRLHAEIQDTFNEHGVQIMSPHFLGQPAQAVVVPRAKWFTAPAAEARSPSAKDR